MLQAQNQTERISIHALREEGDAEVKYIDAHLDDISIHALREEGDTADTVPALAAHRFLSTPSARRATGTVLQAVQHRADFYPRPPRGGRPAGLGFQQLLRDISIHALREEGDDFQAGHGPRC